MTNLVYPVDWLERYLARGHNLDERVLRHIEYAPRSEKEQLAAYGRLSPAERLQLAKELSEYDWEPWPGWRLHCPNPDPKKYRDWTIKPEKPVERVHEKNYQEMLAFLTAKRK